MKMKGLAMLGLDRIGWIEKDKPVPGPFDAIVKPLALAPCTSDIHTVYEGALGERTDLILGHEAVGIIDEVGKEVKDFKPGDKVVVPAITPTWRTLPVELGVPAQHSEGMLTGWKFSNIKDGVFAEFFHVNDADMNLAHMPKELRLEQAIMMPDMMTTGFHGAELADVQIGASVAVLGIGPVGLMAVAGAVLRGAGRLFAVGNRERTFEVAEAYGATDRVDYKKGDVVEQIMDLTNGQGVDHVIIGGGPAITLDYAVRIVKPGGAIGNINYYGSGVDSKDYLPVPRMAWGSGMAHKTIRGGLCPGGRARMERLIEIVLHKRVDPSLLVTHVRRGLEHVEEGIMLMKDKPKDLIKPVIIIDY